MRPNMTGVSPGYHTFISAGRAGYRGDGDFKFWDRLLPEIALQKGFAALRPAHKCFKSGAPRASGGGLETNPGSERYC